MDEQEREGGIKKEKRDREGGWRMENIQSRYWVIGPGLPHIISVDPHNNWTLPFPFCILESPGLGESYNLPKIMSNK